MEYSNTNSNKSTANKSDIVIWDQEKKLCTIVEVCCPADVNISRKIDEKLNNHASPIRNMQMMYSDYKFVVVPLLLEPLVMFQNSKLQNISACGTVKI